MNKNQIELLKILCKEKGYITINDIEDICKCTNIKAEAIIEWLEHKKIISLMDKSFFPAKYTFTFNKNEVNQMNNSGDLSGCLCCQAPYCESGFLGHEDLTNQIPSGNFEEGTDQVLILDKSKLMLLNEFLKENYVSLKEMLNLEGGYIVVLTLTVSIHNGEVE